MSGRTSSDSNPATPSLTPLPVARASAQVQYVRARKGICETVEWRMEAVCGIYCLASWVVAIGICAAPSLLAIGADCKCTLAV